MKQKELSVLLRAIVALCALLALAFAFVVGTITLKSAFLDHNWQSIYLAIFCVMFLPLFLSMWDMWQIFSEIGRDNSFCLENARRLRRISLYALTDTLLVIVTAGIFLIAGGTELGLGLYVFKFFLVVVGIAVTVACSALSHLTRKAALLKDENDLTI